MSRTPIEAKSLLWALIRPTRADVLKGFARDPTQALTVFEANLADIATSVGIVTAALDATQALVGFEQAAVIAAEKNPFYDETRTEAIRAAAKRERESGYPAVYANFAIAMWSVTETLFRDLGRAWLSGPASVWREQAVMSHQVDVREYEIKRKSGEVGEYLFHLLQEALRGNGGARKTRANGRRRETETPFERSLSLMKQIGLPVRGLPKTDREMIRELSLVRNLLAHSPGGRVDERFLKSWPKRWETQWPGLAVGQSLGIGVINVYEYLAALEVLGHRLSLELEARIDELIDG